VPQPAASTEGKPDKDKKNKKEKPKVQNSNLLLLEKTLEMKLKEIRPLHLDSKWSEPSEIKKFVKEYK